MGALRVIILDIFKSDMNDSTPTPSRMLRFSAFVARWIFWSLLAVTLVLAAGWGGLHGWIVPRISEFRPQLETQASRALGVPVRIGDISARSEGLFPTFELHDVAVLDPQGNDALRLPSVVVALSPASLWRRGFDQMYIDGPELDVRRNPQGHISVAGLDLSHGDNNDGHVAEWVFAQTEVVVRNGTIRWTDDLRNAPPLALHSVDLVLRNSARRHALRLDATPPADWGQRFSLVGQFRQPLLGRSTPLWHDWSGQAYADFPWVDVSQLRRHARPGDLGVEVTQGAGAVRLWADIRNGELEGGTVDMALAEVNTTLGTGLQPLALQSVQGRISGRRLATGLTLATQGLQFKTADGLHWPGGNMKVTSTEREGPIPAYGELHADRLDLSVLGQIANRLPLGEATHAALKAYAPAGLVEVVDATWQGPLASPEKYQARGRVTGLALAAQAVPTGAGPHAVGVPGVRGANVDFDVTQAGGRAVLNIKGGALELPGVFDEPVLPLDSFAADTRWQVDGDKIALQMDNVKFANADAQGKMRLNWRTSDPATSGAQSRFPGVLDLTGSLGRGQATRVHRYLPRVLDAEVRAYVRDAVQAGSISSAQFRVKGDLHDLPFTDPKQGDFHIAANVKNATYAYAPPSVQPAGARPWPALTQLTGELVFDRASMQINGANARFAGLPDTRILRANAQIPDLAHAEVTVAADASGPLSEALGLVAASPLSDMTGHALASTTGTGNADYRLKLGLPLHHIDHATVQGSVTLASNDVRISPDTPLLARTRGSINFSNSGFSLSNLQARVLGGDTRLDGGLRMVAAPGNKSTLEPALSLRAQGVLSAEGLRQARELGVVSRLGDYASGSTPYTATLGLRRGVPEMQLTSSLQGLALDLPAPLRKAADTSLPLRFETALTPESVAATGPTGLRDQLQIRLGSLASLAYVRDVSGPQPRVLRGSVAVGLTGAETAPMPDTGVVANAQFADLNLDTWRSVLGKLTAPSTGAPASAAPADTGSGYLPTALALRAQELTFAGRTLHNVVLGGSREGSTWRANTDARELNGYVEYRQPGAASPGGIFARLARLNIPRNATTGVESLLDNQPASMPALDIVVDAMELSGRKLGRVEVDAVNRASSTGAREWLLNKFNISVPEAEMTATGSWSPHAAKDGATGTAGRTALDFGIDIHDSGELLGRFGMKDVVRRGKGRLQGQVAWAGSPLALDYPSLNGQLNVNIESGQFLKADPGLAKLLGVLSLQALPRRLALDFRDVFSQGFAFDSVRGNVNMAQGIASTSNMQMRGVNAAVLMEGSANVDQETQDLRVVVVPELATGTASLVAAMINPAIGLGTFLAQMALRGPLTEAATREFRIDGSWADPRVTRVPHAPRSKNQPPAEPVQVGRNP